MKPSRRRDKGGRSLYRVRVREGKGNFRSALLMGKSPKEAAKKSNGGKILSVTKVSMEELSHTGEFFKLGDQLMREFAKERRKERL